MAALAAGKGAGAEVEAAAAAGAAPGAPAPERPLVFAGFMGAGKSSAARAAAAALGREAIDADAELERELGEPIESFFEREGEAAFRAREEQLAPGLLARAGGRPVALGGGAVGSERVREALREATVVYLEVDAATAWERAAGEGRPLARDRAAFERLHGERRALYESVADAILPAGGDDPERVRRALPALEALAARAPQGTRLVWAQAGESGYPAFFGRGLLAAGFFHPPEGERFLVTDEGVARARPAPPAWGIPPERSLAIPPGEGEKTLARAEEVLRAMARAGVARDWVLVAFGGGVVGDLAGFCAAVYQRGIACVQVPTTLVAQVDSAYGGKTGVDLPEGKNYAGAYHRPAAVLCDPEALETLPEREIAAGYVEVVKTALIAGGELWERVRAGELDDEIVLGCARTKLAVVAADERDAGRRQVLNLGHTVGHAIEAAGGYGRYRHGEAVGIGLLGALSLSGQDALRAEVERLLADRGLPLRFEGATAGEVLALAERDKKRRGGRVPLVLVEAPGRVTHGHDVDPGELRAAVEALRAP